MAKSKLKFRLIGLVTAVISFNLGIIYALAATAVIQDIIFSKVEGASRMTILANRRPDMKVSFDQVKKEIKLTLTSTKADDIFKDIEYSDNVIDSIALSIDKAKESTILTIRFKEENVSFYRSKPFGAQGLTLDFRPSTKKIEVTGVTPEKLMARAPKKEAEAEPEPVPETTEVATEVVTALTPDEKVPQKKGIKQVDPADVEKRFAEDDKKYGVLEKLAGREEFIELMKKLQEEEFAEAASLANLFIETYPKSIYIEKVYYSRAEAQFKLAKRQSEFINITIDSINEALAKFPDSKLTLQAMMKKANLYKTQKFYVEALSEYGGVLRKAPKGKYSVAAMLGRASIFIKKKKFQKGYNELERILILFPNRHEVRDAKYLIAQSFYDRGMYKRARLIFSEAQKIWPTFPKAHPSIFLKIADTNFKTGHIKEAMESWYAIANLFPRSIEGRKALLNIGERYVDIKQKRMGAKFYEALARRFPDNDEGVLGALRLASLGAENPELLRHSLVFDYSAFENPIATFDSVFKNHQKKYGQEALERKGVVLSGRKEYVASIVAFQELLKTYPTARMSERIFNLVRYNFIKLIDTYHSQEGFFMTLMTFYHNFEPFLKSIKEPRVLLQIADSYSAMTLYDRAQEYYKLARARDKDNRYGHISSYKLAGAALHSGKHEIAGNMFRRYIKRYPNAQATNQARLQLGDALIAQGQTAEAATEWRIALEMEPDNAKAGSYIYKLANLYKKEKKYQLAIDSYNNAIVALARQMKTSRGSAGLEGNIQNSYYQIADSYYLNQDYPGAIRWADRYGNMYPKSPENKWMEYIASASLSKIDKQEQAVIRFKAITDKDKDGIIGRVAASRLASEEWKNKNPALFLD